MTARERIEAALRALDQLVEHNWSGQKTERTADARAALTEMERKSDRLRAALEQAATDLSKAGQRLQDADLPFCAEDAWDAADKARAALAAVKEARPCSS